MIGTEARIVVVVVREVAAEVAESAAGTIIGFVFFYVLLVQ